MAITAAKLVIKSSLEPGSAPPTDFLDFGELALNYADGILYYKNSSGVISAIGEVDVASLVDIISDQEIGGEKDFLELASFKAVKMATSDLADGTIVWNAKTHGNIVTVILTEDSDLDGIVDVSAGSYVLRVVQDATGGHTLSFGSNFKTADGSIFEISAIEDSISIITILNVGDSDLYLVGQSNFITPGSGPA